MAKRVADMKPEELREYLETVEPGSQQHTRALAEISRRQLFETFRATEAQIQAAKAEERAAIASEIAAQASVRNARYMFWSVIVATIAAIMATIAAIASAVSAWDTAAQRPAVISSPPANATPPH